MRRLGVLPFVLLAACGPRAVLGHGAHAPNAAPEYGTPSGARAAAAPTPVTGVNLYDEPVAGTSLLDTPIRSVSANAVQPATGSSPLGEPPSGEPPSHEPPPHEPPSGIVISRLPAPHRVAAAEAPAPLTIADAFALAGHRDSRESLAFALATAASLGGTVPAYVAGPAASPMSVNDGPALVAWARERNIFTQPGARLAPGDLVIFDRAAANAPASLVGVVLATDARGVTSFIYAARGVIRIGHLDPARPHIVRDREGRTVNSYIRHTTDYPPAGTRYLAGELLAGSIRLSSSR